LIVGFAGLHWSAGSHLRPLGTDIPFLDDLYMSGTTFFTLGLGDLHPVGRVARLLTVAEAGLGFAFLAIVIAYFPVLYQSFSRREVRLTLLDAWAGSPPAATEVLRRLAARNEMAALQTFLKDWEYWCSEVLESHISYPSVAFFRSQHQRQSWVSALATILNLSALVEVGIEGVPTWQTQVTFAIKRVARYGAGPRGRRRGGVARTGIARPQECRQLLGRVRQRRKPRDRRARAAHCRSSSRRVDPGRLAQAALRGPRRRPDPAH
jgi:hypothetical protein